MPYKCSKCGEEITEEFAEKTVKKFGQAYCGSCLFDVNESDNVSTDEPEQIDEGEANVSPVLPVQTGMRRDVAIQDLDIATIKKYINPKVTDQEAYMFLMLCKSRGLNPFIGEVHLIKYGQEAATTVVGKDAFTRRAEESGQLAGFEAGIIVVTRDDVIERRIGSCVFENETLVGGWAKVYRKDMPDHVFESEVSLTEYIGRKKDGTVNKMWTTKPATMIRKVPLVQVFREAFAASLGGMYDACEVAVDSEVGE